MLLLSVLLFLGPFFQPLPVCVLAAIILASLTGMIKKVADIHKFWSRSIQDGLIWVVTFLSTVFLDVDLGLIVGVVMSLGITLTKANIPTVMVLEKDKNSQEWLDRATYKITRDEECMTKVVEVRGPLNFLTTGLVRNLIEFELKCYNEIRIENKTLKHSITNSSIIKVESCDDNSPLSEKEI